MYRTGRFLLLGVALATGAGALAFPWRELGPSPQAHGYDYGGAPVSVSGRAAAIAFSPNYDGHGTPALYLGSASGGVWRSTDFASGTPTWIPLNDNLGLNPTAEAGAIDTGSLAVDPAHPNIIYVGTGEANFAGDSRYGAGVLKSTDGGNSWTLLGGATLRGQCISRIFVDPTDATGKTLYCSTVFGAGSQFANWGVYKSTDAAATWNQVSTGIASAALITDLEYTVSAAGGLTLIAAAGDPSGAAYNGIWISTNGGGSWARAPGAPAGNAISRISLAADHTPGTDRTVYAVSADPTNETVKGFYKSTDGGANWVTMPYPGNFAGRQGWYDLAIGLAPDGTVYLGGVSAPFNNSAGFLESTDGGNTFLPVDVGVNNVEPHTDHHFISAVGGAIYSANDGGLFRFTPRPAHTSAFALPVRYAAGGSATAVASGRLNADAFADLAVANSGNNTVGVLFGNGSGAFEAATTYAVGAGPVAVAVADLNGGGADIVTANYNDNTISVLLNDGTGAFAPQKAYAVGNAPTAVRVADMNNDTIPDLVVSNLNSGSVSVLLGFGDGTFQPAINTNVGFWPYDVLVGSFTGDANQDIVVASGYNNRVEVYPGLGDGTFGPPVTYPVGNLPVALGTGDLNGDGKPDLVSANWYGQSITVLLNTGAGFTSADYGTGPNPTAVAVANLVGDARPDVAVANYSGSSISVLTNTGGALGPGEIFACGAAPNGILALDLDADTKNDLVTANSGEGTAGVSLAGPVTVKGGPGTWESLNTPGLGTIQIQGMDLHPTDANVALEGSQDNGFARRAGSNIWDTVGGGDGGLMRFDPTNGSFAYKVGPQGSLGTTGFFSVSSDGGVTWEDRTSTISLDLAFPGGEDAPAAPGDTAFPFYPIFTVEVASGQTIAIGSTKVYETKDRGATWNAISGDLSPGNTVSALAYAPSNASVIYAGYSGGAIFRTGNDGASWPSASGGQPWGSRRISAIAVGTTDPNTAFITIASSSAGRVWMTSNGGALWTDISGNLPALPAQSLAVDRRTGALFVGTDLGVWASTDTGGHWFRFGSNLPGVQVVDLPLNQTTNLLAAGTHGRGAWAVGIRPGDVNGDGVVNAQDATLLLKAAGGLVALTSDEAYRAGILGRTAPLTIADVVAVLRK